MTFAEKLYRLRRQKGLSQEELAEQLEVSRQAISRWEMGSTLPDAKNLLQLSDIFGVSIDYLLRDERESPEETPPFRQFTSPDMRKDPLRAERSRQIGLCILVSLQILPLFLYFVGIFIMANTMTLLLASLINLLNIAVYELCFHICANDERGRFYRRKYYRITVWLFSICPVLLAVRLFVTRFPQAQLISLAVYLTVCITVTLLVREKKREP